MPRGGLSINGRIGAGRLINAPEGRQPACDGRGERGLADGAALRPTLPMPTRRALIASSLTALALPGLSRRAFAVATPPPARAVPGLMPGDLRWPGARPEEVAFMRRVYEAHLARSGTRGAFSGDIPRHRLGIADGDVLMLAEAAAACAALLAAARDDLTAARKRKAVKGVQAPAALSAYRPASRQFTLWQRNFPSYFAETADARAALRGGPLGEEAVMHMTEFVRHHLAAPGYSLHNSGKAVDFQTTEQGMWLKADRTQREAWRASWFYGWLIASADRYGFHENEKIDEPWHWEWRGG